MGNLDRGVRLVIAAAIVAAYFMGMLAGTLGIVMLVLAGVFVLTSVIRFCPLYLPFGIRTLPKKS